MAERGPDEAGQAPTLGESAAELAARQAEAARGELKADLKRAQGMAVGLSAAGVLALEGVNLLLFASADLLARYMPRWAARALVGLTVLGAGGGAAAYGWRRRVREPLWQTRASLKSKLQFILGT